MPNSEILSKKDSEDINLVADLLYEEADFLKDKKNANKSKINLSSSNGS